MSFGLVGLLFIRESALVKTGLNNIVVNSSPVINNIFERKCIPRKTVGLEMKKFL